MKKLFLLLSLVFIIVFLGKALNPFSDRMFIFHDETQAARIQQFVLNLKDLQFPPRIAPDFSFKLGFPVFNHYAPTSYWITSLFHLFGLSIINSLKLSFFLGIIIAFLAMYKFAGLFFGFYPSLMAGLLYAASPWVAVEVFIRGNLAELWFLALLPAALWTLYRNAAKPTSKNFLLAVLIVGMTLTAHNVLSIVFIPFALIFILVLKRRLKNMAVLLFSFLVNGYFFIPAILEMGKTHAAMIAKNAQYSQHLLCPWQLWTTPYWGYGGSGPNCIDDGMSFMLGKPQILLGIAGLIFLIIKTLKKDKDRPVHFYMILATTAAFFFTTFLSYPLSKMFEPYLSFFQFPWRFLTFILLGIVFISAAIDFPKKLRHLSWLLLVAGLFVTFYNSKFFTKDLMTNTRFNYDYLSPNYIVNRVAYKVAEYLPQSVDYETWLSFEPQIKKKYRIDDKLRDDIFVHYQDGRPAKIVTQSPFFKQATLQPGKIIVNISYMPYWQVLLGEERFIPDTFDSLGRPIINISKPVLLTVVYKQTPIELLGNAVSIISFVALLVFIKPKKLCQKIP